MSDTEVQTPRVRSRTPLRTAAQEPQAAGRAPPPSDESWLHRGARAEEARTRELERQAQRREQGWIPRRFWMPVGQQADIIILDSEPGPCFYEHNMKNPQDGDKRTLFEACPKEYDSCPLCVQDKESYYVMFLSIIDMRPWTRKDGTVVEWTRKPLAVKSQQQPVFMRLFERHTNLRGIHLLMTRDSQQSFAIGQPEFVGAHTEEELVAAFSHEAGVGNDGRVLRQENADLYPFDYGRILQRNTGEELRRRYGGVVPAGSRQEVAGEWGGHDPGTGQASTPAVAPAPVAGGGIARAADGEQSAQPQGTPPANGDEVAAGGDGPVAEGGEATAQASAPAAGGGITRRAPAQPSSDLDDEIPF